MTTDTVPRNTFPKTARLLKRRQFQQLMHQGIRRSTPLLHVTLTQRAEGPARMGITVSRRYGKAHQRNRYKRLLREAFRLSRHQLPPGLDFNVSPGPAAAHATLAQLRHDLLELLPTTN